DACFFERAERIRGEHFRPLVTAVAGGIAAGEDVLEAVREAIERRRYDDGDVATDFLEDTHDAVRILRLLAVDAQIEQREFELTDCLHAGLESARAEQALEIGFRKRLAR